MMHAKTCRLISTTACFVVILSCVSAATGLQGGADDCFPFDPLDDRLDAGYWTFSTPNNLTSPDCQRHFHVETGTSSDGGTCALKRFGISAARECLRGKHIVMIGDSLMHHQFQSLILFLQTGQHPKAISRNPTPQIAEVTKSARQVTGCGLPWLRCDRPDVPNDPHPNIDNRYYYNAEFDVNVTLLGIYDFANGRSPVGWFPPSIPFDDGWEWKNGGIPRIAAVIQQTFGKVDEILVNVGVWGLPNVFPDKYRSQQHYMTGPIDDVIEELRTLEPLTRRKPIWATTTELVPPTAFKGPAATVSESDRKGTGLLAAKQLGWRILDRYGIKQSLLEAYHKLGKTYSYVYVDFVHFVPHINDEFNNVLLNLICRG